jgi:hypothetical protein
MAHKAILHVERKEYNLLDCNYEFRQEIGTNNQPSGFPKGGVVNFTIVTPCDDDLFFHDWMKSSIEHKDGKIVFTVVDMGLEATKTVHFKRAYCIGLSEYFYGQTDLQMTTKITISITDIAFGENEEVVFEND